MIPAESSSTPDQGTPRRQKRGRRGRQVARQGVEIRAVGLREACRLLGLGYSTGQKRIAFGTFPIAALPKKNAAQHWRFSLNDINDFLLNGSTADVR